MIRRAGVANYPVASPVPRFWLLTIHLEFLQYLWDQALPSPAVHTYLELLKLWKPARHYFVVPKEFLLQFQFFQPLDTYATTRHA